MSADVLCLMGPTASGKTRLAMRLAEKFPVDIISVDSAMVYRGMDIGTAKPTPEELAQFPHQLIDIRNPDEVYSAADFCSDAEKAIEQSLKANRLPVLVGGTMLYFKALQDGLSDLPSKDDAIRAEIEARASAHGWAALHDELRNVDPVSAEKIHANDPQRLSRALEVFALTGKPMSAFLGEQRPSKFSYLNVALVPDDREHLRQMIAKRFEGMLKAGFIDEVKSLMSQYALDPSMPSMRCVGYRQALMHLNGEYDVDAMKEKAITATRQLAKRQLTWLRSWSGLQTFSSETASLDKLRAILNNHLSISF
ncbi:MAG: tRNA (adenosine(37)-N6)-dimethylallyltransferase MiaA [Gammaproteobacteria bacterium CG11_big_fil_rev_8_21_14_0_20_46_22]|nr:MAG: tRNA (adenosine(37)-N6)-dimethylallyltransferase MiaA [Gammaproteobacteria bacterium CG12_big_fil_rev_8_21_14_0_65_46_12]PIR11262.1 MAG: tRNA (adenosine(37)-N6)-dimethylallyltransferase MiaA [Gammaproteobacteria bacterium CG11_big_fil_rev_8_21_14_0_20_46_22]